MTGLNLYLDAFPQDTLQLDIFNEPFPANFRGMQDAGMDVTPYSLWGDI
jgi:hypothetical protein